MKPKYFLRYVIFCLLLIGCSGYVMAQDSKQLAEGVGNQAITAISMQDNKLVIESNGAFTYTLYKSSDPYRATIEIPEITTGAYNDKMIIDKGGILEIIPSHVNTPRKMTRIEIVLQDPSVLIPEYNDKMLTVTLRKEETVAAEVKNVDAGGKQPEPQVKLVVDEKPADKPKAASNGKATEISIIDIKKSAESVKVVITGNGTMIPNVFPINERIVVDIPDVVLKASMPAQAIAPLKSIRAGKHKDKLRLVLDLREKTNFDVTAVGNTIEISLVSKDIPVAQRTSSSVAKDTEATPVPAVKITSQGEQLVDGKYTGKKISLDFQDADVIPIFRLLGDISGYNIVVNPEVKGKVTLKLINVPWDQALDVVLKTFALSKIVDGNVIRIVPTAIMAKELDEMARAKKAASEAGELRTRIFPVNYAQLDKLKDAIDKAKIQSARGSISLDERGSSIIVNDVEANLNRIESLIKELDQEYMQARQVIIEARIVEVNSDYSKDLGIQWGAFYTDGEYTIGGTGRTSTATSGDWIVNLPAGNIAGALGFGFLNKNQTLALDLRLTAMEQINKGKVISSPKIMTMNNESANIKQGRTLQLPTTGTDGQPKLNSVDIVLSLDVTPRITPSGAVLLKMKVTKDELLGLIQAGSSVGADLSKNEANTMVMVNSGETLVIGGIYKKAVNEKSDGIPGLSKLPLIGLLFKNESDTIRDNELLIFITPRVVESTYIR